MGLAKMILRKVLGFVVRRIAADPRVRAKAADVMERELKPRVREAGERARAGIAAARDELRGIAAETDPKRDPSGFARKLGNRVRDVMKDKEPGD